MLDVPSFAAGLAAAPLAWAALSLVRALRPHAQDSRPHAAGLKVVITGSTRGLGLALARKFLSLGDDVVVSSRSAEAVEAAAAKLRAAFPGCRVVAVVADVSKPADVDRLVSRAVEELGQIDIMVCSAAQSARVKQPVAATPASELLFVLSTNLGGALLCARGAIAHMLEQPSGGKVFLVDGTGSRGNATPGNAAYGASKAALVQLGKTLAAELRDAPHVGVHLVSPGMVATDLLLRYADSPRSARFINILAEDASTVAAWLVPRLRGAKGSGEYIKFLTPAVAAWRFLTARSRRGRFVPEGGAGGAGYQRLPAAAS